MILQEDRLSPGREIPPTQEDQQTAHLISVTTEKLKDYREIMRQLGPLTYFILSARRSLMTRVTDGQEGDARIENTQKYYNIVNPVLEFLSVDENKIGVLAEVEEKRMATLQALEDLYFGEAIDPDLPVEELHKEELRAEDLKEAEADSKHSEAREIRMDIIHDKFVRFYEREPEQRQEILRSFEILNSLSFKKTLTKDPAKELSRQTYQILNLDSGKLSKYLTAMAEYGYALKYLVDLFLLPEIQNRVPGILDAIKEKTKTEGLTLNLIRECSAVVCQIRKNLELLKERIGSNAAESLESAGDKIMDSFNKKPFEMSDLLKDINFLESLI